MRRLDSRRLTGPNLLWDRPAAVLDVRFGASDPQSVIDTWQRQVRRVLDAVGWQAEQARVKRLRRGASLAISAPVDALYAATDVNDWAWEASCQILLDGFSEPALEPGCAELRRCIEAEANPAMLALIAEARRRSLPTLVDADRLSIGLGAGSQTWSLDALPPPAAVAWESVYAVPVALVTGTNGKTTTVRMTGAMAAAAGLTAGTSSTDGITIGAQATERGDYAGPGGARSVLRDRRTELAVLETARGGLLRRGLALERADAALITNVAADHIGDFGVSDLGELADVKWIVARAVRHGGRLVLNADDALLVSRGRASGLDIIWFSTDADNAEIAAALARGASVCTLRDDRIVYRTCAQERLVAEVTEIPITCGGRARHNVANALGAVGLGVALGLPWQAISQGLRSFHADANPGRGNIYTINGATVMVDFAHNPHALRALLEVAATLPARRRLLLIGQAGDRGDEDIRELARTACGLDFDRVLIKRMTNYSRGREDGEAARILREELLRQRMPTERLFDCADELDAVESSIDWAGEGDLLVLLVHERRDSVTDYLRSLAGS